MFGNRINRMLFWELTRVFLITLTGLTGLFLVGLVVQQANQLGLSLGQTLAAIPLLVPSTLPFTIPSTTLFAASVAYGRLSHDNEAVALKAAGVNLYTILKPALLLGIITAGTTFFLYHSVIPESQVALHQQVLSDPEEVLYNLLKRDRSFRAPQSPFSIYVRDVQGRRLIDVVLKRRKALKPGQDPITAGYDYIARAREAEIRVDLERSVLLVKLIGWSAIDGNDKQIVYTDDNPEVEVPLPGIFNMENAKGRISSINWDQLLEKSKFHGTFAEEQKTKLEAQRKVYAQLNRPEDLAREERHFNAVIKESLRLKKNAEVEYYLRPALAVSCFCFALVGCPVGLWASRADYLSSFMVCFLPAVFTYYPILLAGSNLARDGKVPIFVGVWLANAVTLIAALALARFLIRR
jgi:lipopolysaccharide export system permease protein